ncbi:prepilin-type N-terminal cleavage/methylation domain-containing protein [Halobacteroides halobius DSM 5150]|uniref:Prepilin-type N-terminal cleavage/methylation domain-containing protein n=1 Tax=Halobacteroides halobius (strain ATCC 35273 / DSM 5150 / MD-1) TaxID=748449 RepID=L0KBH0_HALHC|nr:type II secretion system protein [Halobacteroides halobius]AGB41724.1 prepilin-type N-terminal cleavage/methylation domain-containing protein [Halobacteroides halobius DSM 5150]
MFKKTRRESGFTLIELMVVIAVIGILAGIAIPKLSGVLGKARDTQIKAAASTIRSGMEMYYVSHGKYPSTTDVADYAALDDTLTTVSLPDIKPDIKSDSFTYTVDNDGNSKGYLIEIESGNTDTTFYIGEKGFGTKESAATKL